MTEELAGVIFKNPVTESWETSDEYLSGNVREKLATARTFAENHPEYEVNVQALERVQPKDLDASEIEVRLGATWIEPEYITAVYGGDFWYAGSICSAGRSKCGMLRSTAVADVSGKNADTGIPV